MFGLSREDLAFRDEVFAFVDAEFPKDLSRRLHAGGGPTKEEQVNWHRKLHAKGWAIPHWPAEYGGGNLNQRQRFILSVVLEEYPALTALSMNVNLCGPVIAEFGTPEQKAKFLPRLANLDDWWAQGFSEPQSGSDLASLRLKAEIKGDKFVINGTKMWTTEAQHADWIFVLARTDTEAKPQLGISFILVPMDAPGFSRKPIKILDGSHEVNQCFFDNVEVPLDNLVGELNRGWDCAKFLLMNERFSSVRVGSVNERLRRLKATARAERKNGLPLADDAFFGRKIAAMEAQAVAHRLMTLRLLEDDQNRKPGDPPNPLSSLLKLSACETRQEMVHLLAEVGGASAARMSLELRDDQTDFAAEWAGMATAQYLNYRKLSIAGGTNEVQKTILAKSVLGL
jgi:alkylation response protein AidB-like acyl-CoA dehydrogenase